MQQAAEQLHISERHSRRQLIIRRLDFSTNSAKCIGTKAKQLLGQNLSMSEISLQLGFSELREF